ncbi:hypothetical protein ABT282_15945 [Streptomyces sp. NPDC000927]|uniref:hypothetical protein n=1 Tax=Streptomyces sp. NPDC000927 TaxID=3154371 RepID=UPI00332FBDF9
MPTEEQLAAERVAELHRQAREDYESAPAREAEARNLLAATRSHGNEAGGS